MRRRVLLDQNVAPKIRRFLRDYEVSTAWQMGWDRLTNGYLIAAATEAGFEIIITNDKNIPYQHPTENLQLAIVILAEGRWKELKQYGDILKDAVDAAEAGKISKADIPRRAKLDRPTLQKRNEPK